MADSNGHQVADQLPEGAELVSDEAQKEYDQQHVAILGKIIDRASTDSAWKQKLMNDPGGALKEAGLSQAIEELNPDTPVPAEVTGQHYYTTRWYYYCYYYTSSRSRYFHP